ncbi:MAG: macro domain-containing protein [Nitrospirae bacterium]|nr:macro domain-containing protein [Nitrospirota bacterium]
MEIEIRQGSILEAGTEAIVNAANSIGVMGGGVAGVIRKAAGEAVEREAIKKGPTPVGKAVVTTAGQLAFKGIIHAPTMERPAMLIPASNVGRATSAALHAAEHAKFASLALPGLGTGVGGVSVADAAGEMVKAIADFKSKHLKKVVLMDISGDMVQAWREAQKPPAQGPDSDSSHRPRSTAERAA